MATQPETLFKNQVLRDLKHIPWIYVLKTQELSRRGVLDILCCISGRFVALELKTETGKLDMLQAHTLDRIRRAGGLAFVVTPSLWATIRAAIYKLNPESLNDATKH